MFKEHWVLERGKESPNVHTFVLCITIKRCLVSEKRRELKQN